MPKKSNSFSDLNLIEAIKAVDNGISKKAAAKQFFILYRIYEQLKGNQQNSEVDLELEKEKFNADQSNSAIVTTSSSEVELEKEFLGTSINHPDTLIKNNKNHIILKKLEISPIESCLIWPVTPERKGTRITERVPYIITSDNWKNLYENKEKKKRSIEDEKEMRKKTRDENKILKETKPKKTNKRNIVKNLFSDLSRNYKPESVTSQTIYLETLQFKDSYNIIDELPSSPNPCSNIYNSCIIKTGCCKLYNTDIEQSNLGIECNFCCDKFH